MAQALGLRVAGLTVSRAPGPAGNVEFLIWLLSEGASALSSVPPLDAAAAIERVLDAAAQLGR